jgi:hypothetical protein
VLVVSDDGESEADGSDVWWEMKDGLWGRSSPLYGNSIAT